MGFPTRKPERVDLISTITRPLYGPTNVVLASQCANLELFAEGLLITEHNGMQVAAPWSQIQYVTWAPDTNTILNKVSVSAEEAQSEAAQIIMKSRKKNAPKSE